MRLGILSRYLVTSAMVVMTSFAYADRRAVQYPINQVVEAGLKTDDNTKVQFIISVMYPSGCYTALSSSAELNRQQRAIALTHIASLYEGQCTQAVVHVYPTVEISKPESGTYKVWDSASSRYLGALVVEDQSVSFDRSQADSSFPKEGGNYL